MLILLHKNANAVKNIYIQNRAIINPLKHVTVISRCSQQYKKTFTITFQPVM